MARGTSKKRDNLPAGQTFTADETGSDSAIDKGYDFIKPGETAGFKNKAL